MYQCLFLIYVIFCGISPGFSQQCASSVFPPDSQSGCCGLANGSSLRKNTSKAEIDEFPWMARIEYNNKRSGKLQYRCSGILISGRYVLSAAQCLAASMNIITTPTRVQLGDYDTSNEGKDCVEVKPGQEMCNDGVVSITIEKATSHPNFNSSSRTYDIALIRLAEQVQYTDFIRPICLPTLDITLHAPEHLYMTVAGWGADDYQTMINPSKVLRRVHVPFVDMQICARKYEEKFHFRSLNNLQLCAGTKNRDSCKGDAGGPLMYFNRNKMELGGIVSFGPVPCGQDIPGVYTKVFAYKDWIHSVIEEESRTILKTSSTTSTTTDSGVIYFIED